jgi:ribosomal-protein-alanine acetyltransferase
MLSDISDVLEIERRAYPIPWTQKMLETSLGKDDCFGVESGGVLVGYALVSYILDEAHLLNICIDPRYKRKGYGRKLLQFVVAKAIEKSSSTFFLEVRESNRSAIELYFSEGFNEVGVRPDYYPAKDGREDAVLMTLELSVDIQV